MQHKHLFKRFFIPSLLFFAGASIGIALLVVATGMFQIKHVEVFGVNTTERSALNSIFLHQPILSMQPSDIKKAVLARFPYMEVKEVQIQLPSTVILSVQKEKEFAYIQTDHGYLVVSKTGTILKKERLLDTPTPFVSFYQTLHHGEYQVGGKIGYSVLLRALSFISVLTDEGYRVETVAIDSVDMIACKTKGFEVVFSQTRAMDLQQHEVRQIVKQIKAGALRIIRLDLRFDKPVVQLSPTK